jgi:diaminopimelate decarboxylase|tara:strand:+ start:4249 stop:4371 length:123 start_codon:yes stop_codon:yes gene_type:complete
MGYICETDPFANKYRINEINERDVLAIYNANAYLFMMVSM